MPALIAFCVGENKPKSVLCFYTEELCYIYRKYSTVASKYVQHQWAIQKVSSYIVKDLIKGGITTDHMIMSP